MSTPTVDEAYIHGITDGRAFLRRNPDACPVAELEAAKAMLSPAFGLGDTMKEYVRGHRDFWANQVEQVGGAK